MQRCATLLRRWTYVGIRLPIRKVYPVQALASCSASAVLRVGANVKEYSSSLENIYSEGDEGIIAEKLYSKPRIISFCERSVQRGDVKHTRNTLINYMKMCATTLVHEKQQVKVELAEAIFDLLTENGIKHDAAIFNLLLRIYKYNNHNIVPSQFLERMKENDCQPNLGTFNMLIGAYCNQGNIGGASRLLEYMKGIGLPMSETVYAAMVTGHSRAGDLEAAKGVMGTMKANGHRAHNAVYMSLLCAYAERGLMDDIKKTYDEMKKENVFPSMRTYIVVMETLSMHGHGSLVGDVMSLIKNEAWLAPDLRAMCFGCLSRGEIEAPLIIISHLSQINAVSSSLLALYFPAAFESGLDVREALGKLKESIDIGPFYWLTENIVTSVLFYYVPILKNIEGLPEKDLLEQHPWGKRWLYDVRFVLKMLSEHQRLQDYHFFPLLARHCSEADIKELVKTHYMMMDVRSGMSTTVKMYISQTFSNAGITMDEFFSSQQLHEETDKQWLRELLVFQCAHCRWRDAASTLEKIDDVEDIMEHSGALHRALYLLEPSAKKAIECFDLVVALNKYGDTFSNLLMRFYWSEGKLNMQLFFRLLKEGVEFSLDRVILYYKYLLDAHQLVDPKELWILLKEAKHYTPSGKYLCLLYECVIKKYGSTQFGIEKSSELYERLPQQDKNEFSIRCLRVLQLLSMKETKKALQEFQDICEMDQQIPVLAWKRVVCAAYYQDPSLGDDLLRKMKERNVLPDGYMMCDLIEVHVKREDLTRAEEVLQSIKTRNNMQEMGRLQRDVDMKRCYELMSVLWGDYGDLNKILEVEKQGLLSKRWIAETKVIALLNTKQIDRALEEAIKIRNPTSMYLRRLIKVLIFNDYSLNEWTKVLLKNGVFKNRIDSVVFFTYVDFDLFNKAKGLLKNLKEINPKELQWRMRRPQASKYNELFTELGLGAPPMSTTELENTREIENITDYTLKLDFDDIYKHILDVDRIAEEKKGKVDFQH